MMIERIVAEVEPASVSTSEDIKVTPLKQGDVLLAAQVMVLVPAGAATTSTWQLVFDDGASETSFMSALDAESAAGTRSPAVPQNAPYQPTADGNVECKYTAGSTPGTTVPKARVYLVVARHALL